MSVIVFVLTLDEIDGVSEIMPKVKKEWADAIIFVDGGSTDGTPEKTKVKETPVALELMLRNLILLCFLVLMGTTTQMISQN